MKFMISQDVKRFLDYEMGVINSDKPRVDVVYLDLEIQLEFFSELVNMKVSDERKKWAENEQQRRDYEAFYKDAIPYSHKDRVKFPLQRARILARHYNKFGPHGKQPLIDENENLSEEVLSKDNPVAYVGYVFHKVFRDVKKKLD